MKKGKKKTKVMEEEQMNYYSNEWDELEENWPDEDGNDTDYADGIED